MTKWFDAIHRVICRIIYDEMTQIVRSSDAN